MRVLVIEDSDAARDEDGVSASWGLGTGGARPTTWTTFGAETSAAAVSAAAGPWRRIGTDSWSGGPAATTTWEVLSIAERARL